MDIWQKSMVDMTRDKNNLATHELSLWKVKPQEYMTPFISDSLKEVLT